MSICMICHHRIFYLLEPVPSFATIVFLDANHGVVAIQSAGRQDRRGVSVGGDCRRRGMASFEAGRLARGNRRGVSWDNQRGPRAGCVAQEEQEGEGRGRRRCGGQIKRLCCAASDGWGVTGPTIGPAPAPSSALFSF